MSDTTSIQWADYTWSPWLGCRKVSPGCQNCYITSTAPLRTRHIAHGAQREGLSSAYWIQPLRWNIKAAKEGNRPRVFPSLCDPFDGEVQLAWKVAFWELILKTPNLDWLILTKRPENIALDWDRLAYAGVIAGSSPMPRNVWLGVSVEDQKRADERIPLLLQTRAAVRFLSVEPMLEQIDLKLPHCDGPGPAVDWIIFGGESGKNARPCCIAWIRHGIAQCRETGVRAFVKQVGSNAWFGDARGNPVVQLDLMKHPKGGDPAEWPGDLPVREFPTPLSYNPAD